MDGVEALRAQFKQSAAHGFLALQTIREHGGPALFQELLGEAVRYREDAGRFVGARSPLGAHHAAWLLACSPVPVHRKMLTGVRRLSLTASIVDVSVFASLPDLEELELHACRRLSGLQALTLKSLKLWRGPLEQIEGWPAGLERLALHHLAGLRSIPSLSGVDDVELVDCPALEQPAGLLAPRARTSVVDMPFDEEVLAELMARYPEDEEMAHHGHPLARRLVALLTGEPEGRAQAWELLDALEPDPVLYRALLGTSLVWRRPRFWRTLGLLDDAAVVGLLARSPLPVHRALREEIDELELSIEGFDASCLRRFPRLARLELKGANEDLRGVEEAISLRELTIRQGSFRALLLPPGLERLRLLSVQRLQTLDLTRCPRLDDVHLERCDALRSVEGLARERSRTHVARCARLPSALRLRLSERHPEDREMAADVARQLVRRRASEGEHLTELALAAYARALHDLPDDTGLRWRRERAELRAPTRGPRTRKVTDAQRRASIADLLLVVAGDPKDTDSLQGLALHHHQLGELDEAERWAKEVLPRNQKAAWRRLGMIESARQNPAEAERWLNLYIEASPHSWSGWNSRGCARYALGRKREALADFQQAASLNQTRGTPPANAAEVYLDWGELPAARMQIDEALRREPKRPWVLLMAGRVARAEGDLAEARRAWTAAVAEGSEEAAAELAALGAGDPIP